MICSLQTGDQESWSEGLRAQDRTLHVPGKERASPAFLYLFVLFRPFLDCMPPTHAGRGPSALRRPPIQMLISSRDTLTDTPRKNV